MNQLRSEARGFTLIEVLVALVIIGVGMLGIAKIQALAYSSTATASLRSLAAIEASSLAAAMRANQSYWTTAAVAAPQTISIVGPAVTAATDGTLVGSTNNCSAATFGSSTLLAANDLQCWAASLNTLLPGVTATVLCSPNVTATYPVGCSIQVSWLERNTNINAQVAGAASTPMAAPTYTLYVEP